MTRNEEGMSKATKIIIPILAGLIGFGIGFLSQPVPIIPNVESNLSKIDSLETVISSLQIKRDSIDIVIDTVYIQIENNNQRYEENSNIIINNSTDDNYKFFSEYIQRNKCRLDSVHNL